MAVSADSGISLEELRLAARNHAMPLEALRWPITPAGLHYLLIHYDVPLVDPASFTLEVSGAVGRGVSLGLEELRRRPSRTIILALWDGEEWGLLGSTAGLVLAMAAAWLIGRGSSNARPFPAHSIVTATSIDGRARRSSRPSDSPRATAPPTSSRKAAGSTSGTS